MHEISSYVDAILNPPETINKTPKPIPQPIPQHTKSFHLPKIPNVSKFNDILEDDELIIPANPSSSIIPPGVGSRSQSSIKSDLLKQRQNTSSISSSSSKHISTVNTTSNDPDLKHDPHTIFDFITADDDERFIIWGPDPIALSSSMATTTTASFDRPSSYATLYNNQYEKPELQGFSSNTTNTFPKTKPTKPRKLNRFGSIRLSDLKGPQKRPLYRLSTKEQEKTGASNSFLFKKAFAHKKDPRTTANTTQLANIPQVIEAATTYKLIEKLTSTLDYAFMTDFFLTYRDFIQSQELCQLLISRFTWALQNDEEKRRIVRIRTFVVLRHWLSNYFVHDFIGNQELRKTLTDFLNDLSHHPLVKSSIRDQRIIKTLKRVVRRLKKLYYVRSSATMRVEVISPPPPTMEQKQMSEKIRAKLSQNTIRRATAIRMDMGSDHHGNMAVQDTRNAPVRVVGSLNMKGSLIESGMNGSTKSSQLRRCTSQISNPSTEACVSRLKSSTHKSIQETSEVDTKTNRSSSIATSVSEDSLESNITAGITLSDEEDYLDGELCSREQSITENTENDLHWIREQQETLDYFRELDRQKQKLDQTEYLDSTTPINSHLFAESSTSPRSSKIVKTSLVQFCKPISSNSGLISPVTPGESQNTASNPIRRMSSEKWSKRSTVNDEFNKRMSEPRMSHMLPMELIKDLDLKEASPSGISRKLSEKSIERRKSEKLQESDTGDLPDMPTFKQKKPRMEVSKNDSFSAIPYEETEDLSKHPISPTQSFKPLTKKRLSNALSKVFGQNITSQKVKRLSMEPSDVTPESRVESVKNSTEIKNDKESGEISTEKDQPQTRKRFVSMIAEHLRVNMSGEDIAVSGCECATCSRQSSSTKDCKRLSLPLPLDDERRYSSDLRRRRGISTDLAQEPYGVLDNDTQSTLQRKSKVKPVYLGQLDSASIPESSRKGPKSIETVGSDDEQDTESISERSIPTESYHAGDINLDSSMIRSKIVELDIPPHSFSRTQDRSAIEDTSGIPKLITINSEKSFIMYYRTSKLASQFCFIERDVLTKVGWEELIHCKWTKMDANGKINTNYANSDTIYKENHPNINYTRENEKRRTQEQGIEYVIQRFNAVCLWVSSEIVRTKNINDRVKLIEKFIRLANKCKDYSNYATLVQILLGLQSPTVTHLEKTWSKVSIKYQKQLSKLTEFSSPMKNWKHIRDSMTEVAEEYGNSPQEVQVMMPSTAAEKQRFKKTRVKMPFGGCIPFLGIYLSDLVFNSEKPRHLKPNSDKRKIYDANTTKSMPPCLDEPLVNFRKYRVIATVIKRVLIFRGLALRYSFDEDPELKNMCINLNILDADVIRDLGAKIQ